MPAIRAAAAGPRAARGDVKDPRVVARDLFDAAARHRTELVHAPFYGVQCVTFQTPVPTGAIRGRPIERAQIHSKRTKLEHQAAARVARAAGRLRRARKPSGSNLLSPVQR